jgi:hypothetical protein
MTEAPTSSESRPAGSAGKKTARGKRASAARKRTPPRPAAGRTRARRSRTRSETLERLLARFSAEASRAGRRIASLSEEGVVGARKTWGKASSVSRKTVDRLAQQWKKMDSRKRVQVVTALLAAFAAASAPIVRKTLKKR